MTPKQLVIACLSLFCALFAQAADLDLDFHPQISVLGFYNSPSNTRQKSYGQGQLSLPASLFLNEYFSLHAQYFFAYDYYNKQESSYNKLNRAVISFNADSLEVKIGRDFLDWGLKPVIYFGTYEDKDLKKPTYLDGGFANYKLGKYIDISLLGAKFDETDLYGAKLALGFLEGFYFISKEGTFDLENFGGALNFENDTFALHFLTAFNRGQKTKKILWYTYKQKYNGYLISGDMVFKKDRKLFDTQFSVGAEYLSPNKENAFGYRPVYANFDKGFIFGNLNEGLETLTYKMGFNIRPNFLKDLSADIRIYNFKATNKDFIYKDIASELDLSLLYQYNKFSFKLSYGYLKSLNAFANFTSGFEEKAAISKTGFLISYQF